MPAATARTQPSHPAVQLASPSEAVQWDGTHMGPHNGSMLDHFKEKGVVWLMSIRMLDLHWCVPLPPPPPPVALLCL